MRLFFAIWPDALAAVALDDLARRLAERAGGKAVPAAKMHLTLAFLGEVAPARVESAAAAASQVQGRAMEIVLDEVGSFRAARVAWAGCSRPAPELLALQAQLALALEAREFALEQRAYAPHLTLVRRIARPIAREAGEPIRWRARELALVRSEPGTGSYSTLGRWELG